MTKIALAALASVAALAAVPAAAQSTNGTINVTGTVAARCSVIQAGSDSQAFTGTLDLGRLDATDGTLKSELVQSSTTSLASAQKVAARVVCTNANPTVGVKATRLSNAGATPAAGYANVIDYTATLKVKTAANTTVETQFKTDTDSGVVSARLGNRIAGGSESNVEVGIFALKAVGGAASVLEAGTYNSVVNVSIEPTV